MRPTAENLLSSVMQQHKATAGAVLIEMLQKSASDASTAASGASEQASIKSCFCPSGVVLLFGDLVFILHGMTKLCA